jgi:hypothetical protein
VIALASVATAATLALVVAASSSPSPSPPLPVAAQGTSEPAGTDLPPAADALPDPVREWAEPPAGSPEDQALFRDGLEASKQVTLVRLEARRLQWRARERSYERRLETLKDAGESRSRRAGELLARYRDVVPRHYQTLVRQWPVDPTRGCSYQVLHLGGVMASDGPRKARQLLIVRGELEDCVGRARPAILVMADLNAQVQALLAEAEGLLPPVAPSVQVRRGAP